jgi:hypothetical protein
MLQRPPADGLRTRSGLATIRPGEGYEGRDGHTIHPTKTDGGRQGEVSHDSLHYRRLLS